MFCGNDQPRVVLGLLLGLFGISGCTLQMPGKSFTGPQPPLTKSELIVEKHVKEDVEHLSSLGPRQMLVAPQNLEATARFIEERFSAMGYETVSLPYQCRGQTVRNIEATLPGTDHDSAMLLIGAHYDSVRNTPGANDNASGVAAMLEIARMIKDMHPARTVRFVAFTNEEIPFFHTRHMGSIVYARLMRERGDHILGLINLDVLGYYSHERHSQRFPLPFRWFLPDIGDFVIIYGRTEDTGWIKQCVSYFRGNTPFPAQGASVPAWWPGAWSSDHAAFWRSGYPGIHVWSVARYPEIHSPRDTPDRLDYPDLARVTEGVGRLVEQFANGP